MRRHPMASSSLSMVSALETAAALGCGTVGGGGDDDDVDAGLAPCTLPAITDTGASTLAGCAEPGNTDGARGAVRFANPVTVLGGPGGNVYVADFDNNRI